MVRASRFAIGKVGGPIPPLAYSKRKPFRNGGLFCSRVALNKHENICKMEEYFVYILYSQYKDRYYIGSCSNLHTRLDRHNAGATPSTKAGRPWKLVYSEMYSSKSEALKRENYIKKQKSRLYIVSLINSSDG